MVALHGIPYPKPDFPGLGEVASAGVGMAAAPEPGLTRQVS